MPICGSPPSAAAARRGNRGGGAARPRTAPPRVPPTHRSAKSNSPILAAREEFVLVLTEKGYGKRSSAYDYPITGRGGQGRENNDPSRGQGAMVAVFPVAQGDQIMLVTDGGTLIRCRSTTSASAAAQRRRHGVQGRRGRARRVGGAACPIPATMAATAMPGERAKRERHMSTRIGVYPGTFDPITNGHTDIILRAVQDRRSPGHRRRPQCRQGAAVLDRRARRDRARRARPSRRRSAPSASRCGPSTPC